MREKCLITIIFVFSSVIAAFAQQQITGKITDIKGLPVPSVNITLKNNKGLVSGFSTSDKDGTYHIKRTEFTDGLVLTVTAIGYETRTTAVTGLNRNYNIVLTESEINLKTVVVKNRPVLTVNGDTLNYKVSDFAGKQDRTIGEVLKKMPGIVIAENGKITYNGKDISNLYIDGDNILDDRYNIGTKIPQSAVEKVQVIEKDQPVKMLRKNNISQDVALNLVITEKGRLNLMGDAATGLGVPGKFDASGTALLFKKDVKFINNVQGNNIGIDPGIELTGYNMAGYPDKTGNNKPGYFLSAGAAGVPLLPENRSLFNKSGLINLNDLYKLNKDLQIRASIAYLYDQRNQQYKKSSATYLSGQTINYNEQQDNDIRLQKLRAQFNFNGNTEKYYLNNILLLAYAPVTTNSNLVINSIHANQYLKQQTFDVSNELNYSKKLESANAVNFYSLLSSSSQPELLSVKPGLNEAILNNGAPYEGLNQYVKIPTLFNNNYLSFSLVKNRFTQTYKGGFSIQQQKLKSGLYSIQHNTEIPISKDMVNDLNWLKTKLYMEADYEYAGEKLKGSVSIPLSYHKIGYNDPDRTLNKSLDKIFINPLLNIRYQTGSENYVSANYSFKNDLGTIEDIYQSTILKNYRSLFANNAPVSEQHAHHISAGYDFKKTTELFLFNLKASYKNTSLNTISSYTISNQTQQRIILPLKNKNTDLSVEANASKYIFNWGSTINTGISYSQNKFDQLQNEELLPITSRTFSFRAGVETKLTSFLKWSYNANYSTNQNSSIGFKTSYQQLNQKSSLTVTGVNNLLMTISAEHILTHQSEMAGLSYLFTDINAQYKLKALHTDLQFGITNLADIKKFEAINISANTFTSGTYYIPGRVAMLKATFTF